MADEQEKNKLADQFEPYIKAHENIPELTLRAVILGAIIAVVFGVANAYLGLKVGMTVSASIPAAVISMAVLRGVFKKGTVLENNIVQTIGSSGESLAAGIIFTIPAFFIWNETLKGFSHPISNLDIIFLSVLGGSLGILFMIPLRSYLIVREHNRLKFPEGTACAEILKAGDTGGSKAKTVFAGLGIAALYKSLMSGLRLWPESASCNLPLKGASVGIEATPALLGVGYIIGPRTAAVMLAGAVLGYLGIAPLIAFFGEHIPNAIPPALKAIKDMGPSEIRNNFIKYIGVGAVALGGFVSLAKAIPAIIHSFAGVKDLAKTSQQQQLRTDKDLPMYVVLFGSLAVALAIWAYPGTELHLVGTILVIVFGFFFVAVAARIVGIVGSSSSPVSGMTLATILVTSVILLSFGVSGHSGMISVMSIGTVVCIAVCMSGDIAQDLKTGYLLGATPKTQQLMEFVGLIFPAIFMGFSVFLLNSAFGFVKSANHPDPLPAPQANVMATVVQGMMGGGIPWDYIIAGAVIALAVELLGVSSLPFAIGLYLPLGLSTPIMAGGIIAFIVQKLSRENERKEREANGVIFSSGLVAGDALVGVGIALLLVLVPGYPRFCEHQESADIFVKYGPTIALVCFAAIALLLWNSTRLNNKTQSSG